MNSYLQTCQDVILDATSGLTTEAAARRAGDRWSVVEIAEHLQRAYSGTAFGSVRVLDHPILGALTVDQWVRFHLVHTEHHERQIRARR